MVRTKGLGRALGRVVNRGLGRGDHDDPDGAPQWRSPTASACKQWVSVIVVDDEPVVPVVAADKPMVDAHV